MIAVEQFLPQKYAGVVKEISSYTIKGTEVNEYLISPLLLHKDYTNKQINNSYYKKFSNPYTGENLKDGITIRSDKLNAEDSEIMKSLNEGDVITFTASMCIRFEHGCDGNLIHQENYAKNTENVEVYKPHISCNVDLIDKYKGENR